MHDGLSHNKDTNLNFTPVAAANQFSERYTGKKQGATLCNQYAGVSGRKQEMASFQKQTLSLGKVTSSNFPMTLGVNQFYTKNIPARSSVNMQQETDAESWEVKKETEEDMGKVKNADAKNYWDEQMDIRL